MVFSFIVSCKSLDNVADDSPSVVIVLSTVSRTEFDSKLTPFTCSIALLKAFFRAISKVSAFPLAVVSI